MCGSEPSLLSLMQPAVEFWSSCPLSLGALRIVSGATSVRLGGFVLLPIFLFTKSAPTRVEAAREFPGNAQSPPRG
jgi:hypothetical protein